jgi:AraC-like DNA-binding protein
MPTIPFHDSLRAGGLAPVSGDDFVALDRIPALGGVDLFRARFVTRASRAHSHAEFEIGVVVSGRRLVHCRGRTYRATGGAVLVFAPGEVHHGSPLDGEGSAYLSFLLTPPQVLQAFDRGGQAPWFETPVIQDEQMAGRLARVHWALEYADGDPEPGRRLLDEVGDLVRRYGRPQAATVQEHHAVRHVRAHLEEHYASRIRLEALAASVDLSIFQLIRLFRGATGLPPYAYLAQVRIDRAIDLLRAGHPVSDVAFRTGFSDQSHLTRFFKRLLGVPPGRYRRSVLRRRPGPLDSTGDPAS